MAATKLLDGVESLGIVAERASEMLYLAGNIRPIHIDKHAQHYAALLCDVYPRFMKLYHDYIHVFLALPAKAPPPHSSDFLLGEDWWYPYQTIPCQCELLRNELASFARTFCSMTRFTEKHLCKSNESKVADALKQFIDKKQLANWFPGCGEAAYIQWYLVGHEWESVHDSLMHLGGKLPVKPKRPPRTLGDKLADEGRVYEYLLEHPDATRDEITHATGIANQHVSDTNAWKEHRRKRQGARRANRATPSSSLDLMPTQDHH